MYFHAAHLADVRFTAIVHKGDGALLARHVASSSDIPLKLQPPYVPIGESGAHGGGGHRRALASGGYDDPTVDLCHLHDGEEAYLAVFGGDHCMVALAITALPTAAAIAANLQPHPRRRPRCRSSR